MRGFFIVLESICFVKESKERMIEPQRHNAAAAAHKGVHEKYK
jgi:hypothetical protein